VRRVRRAGDNGLVVPRRARVRGGATRRWMRTGLRYGQLQVAAAVAQSWPDGAVRGRAGPRSKVRKRKLRCDGLGVMWVLALWVPARST
jgi:hypothetical protein